MTAKTRYFVVSSLLVMFVGVGTGLVAYYRGVPTPFAVKAGPEELQYVPRDAAVIAYANVREVMASELRQRFRRSQGQENGQRELQEQTGINLETDIDHVVACLEPSVAGGMPAGGLVLARGLFNELKIEALMREHGARVDEYKGARIIVAAPHPPDVNSSAPDGNAAPRPPIAVKNQEFGVSFVKPGLVALGSPAMIHRVIDIEGSGENVTANDEAMNLIRSVESGNAWAVGRLDALRNAAPPAAADQLTQLPAISWFSAVGHINDGVQGTLRAETGTAEAAKNLAEVVQGFIALARLQGGSKPEFQAVLQSLQLTAAEKSVSLSFSIPSQIFDLLPQAGSQPGPRRQAH